MSTTTIETKKALEEVAKQQSKKSLLIPESLELVSGDLDKLEDPNSTEIVFFKKKGLDEVKEIKENKESRENKGIIGVLEPSFNNNKSKLEIRYLAVRRSVESHYDSISRKQKVTQNKPITLYFTGKEQDEPSERGGNMYTNFVTREKGWMHLFANPDFSFQFEPHTSLGLDPFFDYARKSFGYQISMLSEKWVDEIFQYLLDEKFLSHKEMLYFKALCGHAPISKVEQELRAKVKFALEKKAYDETIRLTKELYSLSCQNAKENYRIQCTVTDDGDETEKLSYFVESTFPFELGEILELISPAHAIQAFEIITPEDEEFDSPLHDAAMEKIGQIAFSLCAATKDEQEKRKYREMAMKFLLRSSDLKGDNFKLFLKMLDAHCGYEPFSSNTLFKNYRIKENSTDTLMGVFFAMADRIYHFEKQQKLSNTALKKTEAEAQTSKSLTFSTASVSAASVSNTTSALSGTKSLDSDDEEEEAQLNTSSKFVPH